MIFINYIILDLEFNSTKISESDKHINEIIEIGAVKLNDRFIEIDSFTSMVKPIFSKKLNSFVKKLTHITEKELKKSKDFKSVIDDFVKWCAPDAETIFLTWSDTDLHVLVENYKEILKRDSVDFIINYSDLQKYVQTYIKTENNNQISLKAAAEHYNINTENFSLHRAEDDSRICGKILGSCYEKETFSKHIRSVNEPDFYKKLLFKPYSISDLKAEGIDKDKIFFDCPVCKNKIKFNGKYNPKIKAFTNITRCDKCKKKIAVTFRFKKSYDKINISSRAREFVKKPKASE